MWFIYIYFLYISKIQCSLFWSILLFFQSMFKWKQDVCLCQRTYKQSSMFWKVIYIYIYSFIYSIRQNSIYCAVYYYSYSHIHHIWFYIFHKIKFSMFWSVLFIQSTLKWKWDAGFCQWRYKQAIIFGKGLSLAAPENWTQWRHWYCK